MENLVYDTTEHQHYIRFFLKDDSSECVIDFTGLLVNPFSYNVILTAPLIIPSLAVIVSSMCLSLFIQKAH